NPTQPSEVTTGFQHSVELGLYYLKENRLDEADQLFLELAKPERKVVPYRYLGRMGHAIVLAYKDDAAGSNQEFLAIFADIERIESRVFPKLDRPFKKDFVALKD